MEHVSIAKLFKDGNSQAVRLPKEFRFEGDEVVIYREAGRVILQPKDNNWDDFFFNQPKVSPDFMQEREDTIPQQRKKLF